MGGLLGALVSGASFAAETGESSNFVTEEVFVEAQKIRRSLMETIESVKVFDAETLEDSTRADDIFDLLERTANVSRNGSFDYSIRGISSLGPTGNADGARVITMYVDGSPQTARAAQAGAISLWDVEQVEILRGPQSTNQGRNALAGSIFVKTKDPEFDAGGAVRVSYADSGTYQTAIAYTAPITDNVAYRIAIDRQHADGFIDNVTLNDDSWDEETNTNIRGKLLFQLGEESRILITVSDVDFEDFGDDNVQGVNPEAPFNRNEAFDRQAYDNFPSAFLTDINSYAIDYSSTISDSWEFSSITTYIKSVFDRDSDADAFAIRDGISVLSQDTDENNLTQEFLFNFDGERAKAIVGLYYSKGELDDFFISEDATINLGTIAIPGVGTITVPPVQLNFSSDTNEEFENTALFINIDYSVTDALTIVAGLRADYEERSNFIESGGERTSSTGIPDIDALIDAQVLGSVGSADGEESFSVFLPKIGLDYQWSDNINTGFVAQRGYRSGGVTTNIVRSSTQEYDAEFTDNYEFSVRTVWMDKMVNVNFNLFYTDWKDQQVEVLGGLGDFDIFTENAGESHLWGFEIESAIQPTDNLRIDVSIGHVNTKFDEFIAVLGEETIDFGGNEFGRAPEWTANLGMVYRLSSRWFAGGNISHVGSAFVDEFNEIELDAYSLVNVKAGYESDGWSLYLFANNLLDNEYISGEFDNPIRGYEVGDPRLVGLQLNADF